jgi:hypothetical protein
MEGQGASCSPGVLVESDAGRDPGGPATESDAGSRLGLGGSSAGSERPLPVSSPFSPDAAPGDVVAPQVVSSVPPDGATGVRQDTSLSIVFSEPMDQTSVEAAFSSDSLPTGALRWNADGTVLDIVLGAPLSYATGADPSQLPALRYDYRLSIGARDLAGNSLPETSVSFSTLREISVSSSARAASELTGSWRSDGTFGTGSCATASSNICIGDSNFGPNASYRGFVSFDLSVIPSDSVELTEARLELEVDSLIGDPFDDLGQLLVEDVTFATIGPAAFAAAGLAVPGGATTARVGTLLSFDVLGALPSDLADDSSQYRLRFQSVSDGDGAADALLLLRSSAALRVSYLLP